VSEPGASAEDILDLRVDDLLDEVASRGTIASGAVAAVVAALAAELVAAAARRSEGQWEHAAGAAAQGHALRLRVAPLASSDARAYAEASDLLAGAAAASGSEQRDHRLGRALSRAAEVPLLIAQVAADVAALAKEAAEHGTGAARADATGAALLALGAARAAAHLVEVNLGATPEDGRVRSARALADEARTWAEDALALE
jgi:formiminotetrahydrofolate cyclodeaminase